MSSPTSGSPSPGVSGSVQTATLRLWVTSATANGPAVYTTDNTWSETTITWANRPARTGSGVDDKASVPSGAWVDFNVTSLVPGDGTYNFVLAGTSSDGVDFSSREATNKPQLVVTTAAPGDVTNPSDPTGLGAVAISSGRVDLSWTASTDNVGVTGYEIFRNGTLLPPVGAVTTFADTTVAPSTAYTYQVRAFDAAGNRSGLSASAGATTPAAPSTTTSTFAPTADAYVAEATSSTNFGTSTTLRVDAGTDPDVESYIRFPVTGLTGSIQSAKLRLWVGSDATANGPAVYTTASTWSEGSITWANRTARVGTGTDDKGSIPTNSWVEYNVASLIAGNGTYDFVLAGTSTDGINFSSREATTNKPQLVIVSQTSNDTENPTDPSSLSATPTSGTRVDLSWTGSTDNTGVTNYEIFRNGSLLTTVGNVTSYADTSAVNATTYDYKVRALDGAGNRSGFSNTASATTPDTTQDPLPPSNLVATVITATRVDLSWTAGSDNVGVTNYEIFRGGSLLTTVGNVTSYSDTTVLAGATYSYQVRAMDAAGHRSTLSNTATVTTTDGVAPSQPTNLVATAAAYNRINLSWTASTDNVAVTNYEIYRGGALLATVGAVTSYSDTAVSPGTSYSYQVKAMDLAGNRSGFSNTSSATTPQQLVTLTPTADARVEQATPTTNFGTATALRVDAGSTPVESYLLFNASGLAGTLRHATLRLWASSGTADGPAVYTSPTNWTETGITWANRPTRAGAGTDDKAGISTGTWVEYDVTTLMTGNGTWSFVLAGVSSDGVDFHSKEAANDPQLVITMGAADTQPPSAPTLSGAAPSPTQVDLSWTTPTDDVAVTGYDLYRGATLIASLGLVNTYSDTTVSANTTYTYTVKARDRAGNVSSASNTVTVRTPTSGGTSPVIATAGDIACANTDAGYNGGAGTSTTCQQLATSNLLINGGFAAVLVLGDNQYNSGSLTQFNAVYNPTWGRVKSITHPAIGNHEYGTSNASGYFTYFGSSAGDPAKGYYSYDIGTWHVVTLNSNCTIVACTAGSAQEQWLRSDLSAHPSTCTVAVTHHARWSSGHDGDNVFLQPLWQALIDGGVDVLLSGHSHNYERFAPQNANGGLDNTNGIRQFVVGTGGAFFTGVGSAHPNSQVRNNDTFGILKMTLRPTGYDWQFVRAAGGSFTDSGSTACH